MGQHGLGVGQGAGAHRAAGGQVGAQFLLLVRLKRAGGKEQEKIAAFVTGQEISELPSIHTKGITQTDDPLSDIRFDGAQRFIQTFGNLAVAEVLEE